MRKLGAVAGLVLCLELVGGCAKAPSGPPGLGSLKAACDSSLRTHADGAWIDPGMLETGCDDTKKVFHALESASIKAPAESQFAQIFRGTDSRAVMDYLDTRIHYIFPDHATMYMRQGESVIVLKNVNDRTLAANIGMGMWLQKKASKTSSAPQFQLGSTVLPADLPSSGFIQLGPLFQVFPLIHKMGTMVHEARHSDCESESSATCGLRHVPCPTGHELADLYACDESGYGPYMVGASYAKVLAETCSNCTEGEKQIALLSATDSLSRVLNLSDILGGKIVASDMGLYPGYEAKAFRASLESVHSSRRKERNSK